MNKKELGQFYTTNAKYITKGLLDIFPKKATIIDPFAGHWDLLNLVKDNNNVLAYDIDPKNKKTIKRDTLENPLKYNGLWVFTNPPYLARNKNKNKKLYDKYDTNDLYKIAMLTLLDIEGGILIIPSNFFTSNDNKIRNSFLSKYEVVKATIFEESVFDDTDLSVVAFSFIKKENKEQTIEFNFKPSNKKVSIKLEKKCGYKIGSELDKLKQSKIKVSRLLKEQKSNTNIFLRAIDTGSSDGQIKLEYNETPYYGINTDRSFATIKLSENISIEDQKKIIKEFNKRLNDYRNKYNSLFLTNFRNSVDGKARKRISFTLTYKIISNIMYDLKIEKENTLEELEN